ncbi:MAG: adenosine deaminase [Wujia sp.]
MTAISSMPKIDLHCHLDGSFRKSYVMDCLGLDALSEDRLRAPADCDSLTTYLTCFDLPISCLQTKKGITKGVLDVLEQASAEGVRYIELRFAPSCSKNEELSFPDIIEAAIDGCEQGKRFSIESNLILCAMRHHTREQNEEVLHYTREYLGHHVCAMDLAGDESAFPNECFKDLFEGARRYNLPFTIHSGECGRTENVKLALEYGAKRVGHGIALYKEPSLMQACKEARLGLELCPTSNFQTRAATDAATYPLRAFLDYGLLATVNTDNRTVSNTNSTQELLLCLERLGITKKDLRTLYENSVEISFADDAIKHHLLQEFYQSWK